MDFPRIRQAFVFFLAVALLAGCASPSPIPTPIAPTSSPVPTSSLKEVMTPTATIDLIAAQSFARLYAQDFEAAIPTGIIDKSGKWSLSIQEDGNHVYCNEISTDWQSFHFGMETWTNYAVEMRVEFQALGPGQNAEVYSRVNSGNSGYRANIYAGGAQLRYYPPPQELGGIPLATNGNTWYTLRVEAAGDRLRFYVDNQLISNIRDSQRLSGYAGFGAAPGTSTCVDDIRVWALTPDGQIAPSALADQVMSNNPLSSYEGDCVFCFIDGSDPSMPVWNDSLQGYQPQPGDTREQINLNENFSVPVGKTVTFENKVIIIRSQQTHDILVYGTLVIDHSLLIWEQTGYQQTGLRIKKGGKLSIKDSYSFLGNRFWVNWEYEDGSKVSLDHFVGDPWTTIDGSVDYTAINYSTVSVTIFGGVKNTNFKVTDSHHVWLELYPPPGTYEITFPAKRQWADWTISDIWPGTVLSITHSYIYERDISIDRDVHVTISDTPSGFSLGWSINKNNPGFIDCELKDLGEPGNDQGVFYKNTTWDLPCNNSSLTVRNSLLQRAWPVTFGYVHLKVYRSNLADPRNYGAPATYEIYDSTIGLVVAYSGGRIYLENSKIYNDIEINGSNSIIYAYGVSSVDPVKGLSILQESGGKYIEMKNAGPPWK